MGPVGVLFGFIHMGHSYEAYRNADGSVSALDAGDALFTVPANINASVLLLKFLLDLRDRALKEGEMIGRARARHEVLNALGLRGDF